jgi:hypothetical protein
LNPYKYQAKKVIVSGHTKIGLPYNDHTYASQLEAKMAVILLQNKIFFEPHKKFDVFDRHGQSFTYTVDFVFDVPRKFGFMPGWVMGLEVKGVLQYKDLRRKDALEYCHNLPIFLVTEPIMEVWQREGLWKDDYNKLVEGGKDDG